MKERSLKLIGYALGAMIALLMVLCILIAIIFGRASNINPAVPIINLFVFTSGLVVSVMRIRETMKDHSETQISNRKFLALSLPWFLLILFGIIAIVLSLLYGNYRDSPSHACSGQPRFPMSPDCHASS